jgi:hypothetical protein
VCFMLIDFSSRIKSHYRRRKRCSSNSTFIPHPHTIFILIRNCNCIFSLSLSLSLSLLSSLLYVRTYIHTHSLVYILNDTAQCRTKGKFSLPLLRYFSFFLFYSSLSQSPRIYTRIRFIIIIAYKALHQHSVPTYLYNYSLFSTLSHFSLKRLFFLAVLTALVCAIQGKIRRRRRGKISLFIAFKVAIELGII